MLESLKTVIPYITPIFVISTMLNVGLTQRLSEIIEHLKSGSFVLKMLVANFVLAPLVMFFLLYFAPFEPPTEGGLLIYSMCAGAPLLIKLTRAAERKIARGAAVMTLLIVVTIVYVPIVLPLVLSGLTVDAWAVAESLLLQMLLPVVAGMLIVQFTPGFAKKAQPWLGWLGSVALYVLIGVILIGYFPNVTAIVGTGAIFVVPAFVFAAFGIGDLLGAGKTRLRDIGALVTAQRNTAAAMIVAVWNFKEYPDVLVIIAFAHTLGIILLMFVAKRLSRDHQVKAETV